MKAKRGVPAAGGRRIALIHEMSLMWYSVRCLFLLPVTIQDDGVMRFSWRSWWARYSLVGWLCFVPYMTKSVLTEYKHVLKGVGDGHTLQQATREGTALMASVFTIFLPIPMFACMLGFARLTAAWKRMEVMFESLTGAPLVLGLRWVHQVTPLVLAYAGVVSVTLWIELGLPLWILPPLTQCTYAIFGVVAIWISCFLALGMLASRLGRRLAADAQQMGADGIRMHRLLWLQVVKLLQIFCESNTVVMVPYMFLMFVMCVSYVFCFVHTLPGLLRDLFSLNILHSQHLWSGLVANAILFGTPGGGFLVVCLSAQFVVNQIFWIPLKGLLRMPQSTKSSAVRSEIHYFLKDIYCRKPVVSLCGVLSIDHTTIVKAVVSCTTYILVLSQFTAASK